MAASASAQNTMTSSPYSMFGLGEMASGLYGQNTSMAGVTVGMREGMLMNIENPAGLTALDSCKLFAEASAFVKNERYRFLIGRAYHATVVYVRRGNSL